MCTDIGQFKAENFSKCLASYRLMGFSPKNKVSGNLRLRSLRCRDVPLIQPHVPLGIFLVVCATPRPNNNRYSQHADIHDIFLSHSLGANASHMHAAVLSLVMQSFFRTCPKGKPSYRLLFSSLCEGNGWPGDVVDYVTCVLTFCFPRFQAVRASRSQYNFFFPPLSTSM